MSKQQTKKVADNKTNYTTVATIKKVEKGADESAVVRIIGFGKYLYEDSDKKQWNILEKDSKPFKFISIDEPIIYQIPQGDSVFNQLVALSIFHKRPLKLTIEKEKGAYIITAIEVE